MKPSLCKPWAGTNPGLPKTRIPKHREAPCEARPPGRVRQTGSAALRQTAGFIGLPTPPAPFGAASWRAAREPPDGVSCSSAPAAAPPAPSPRLANELNRFRFPTFHRPRGVPQRIFATQPPPALPFREANPRPAESAAAPSGGLEMFHLSDPGPPLRSGPRLHALAPSGGLFRAWLDATRGEVQPQSSDAL